MELQERFHLAELFHDKAADRIVRGRFGGIAGVLDRRHVIGPAHTTNGRNIYDASLGFRSTDVPAASGALPKAQSRSRSSTP